MLASFPTDGGQSCVIHRTAYSPILKKGVVVFYFGYGCDPEDNGWTLAFIEPIESAEFETAAKSIIKQMGGVIC